MEVTVKTTVEIGDAERGVTLKFTCHPAEAKTRTYPGCQEYAECVSCIFDDTGDDAEAFVDMAGCECAALAGAADIAKAADAEAADAKDAAAEAKWEERREERRVEEE